MNFVPMGDDLEVPWSKLRHGQVGFGIGNAWSIFKKMEVAWTLLKQGVLIIPGMTYEDLWNHLDGLRIVDKD